MSGEAVTVQLSWMLYQRGAQLACKRLSWHAKGMLQMLVAEEKSWALKLTLLSQATLAEHEGRHYLGEKIIFKLRRSVCDNVRT